MTKNEAEEHLKKSTVKIDSPCDVGSGFFIDKNLIATCHHVVEGCSASELEIVWQGSSYQATSIESNPDDDLALVSVKIDKKHPCVQIDKSIETGDECFSFGFPKAYRDIGDTLTFVSEGHNEKFLKFKKGQFESGFSGAPILNYRTLKVCGVVKRTRDEYSDLGGRGIPISILRKFLKSKNYDIDDNGSIFSKEMFKNWVWTSSVESADRLQFSVLALVETLVAVGVAFFVWFYYGFYWHIVTGLIVAPLFFLRSKKTMYHSFALFSTPKLFFQLIIAFIALYLLSLISLYTSEYNFGPGSSSLDSFMMYIWIFLISIYMLLYSEMYIFKAIVYSIIISFFVYMLKESYIFQGFSIFVMVASMYLYIMIILYLIGIILLALYVKIHSTLVYMSLASFKRIPKNWFRIILSMDSFHYIEILPGMEKYLNKDMSKTLYSLKLSILRGKLQNYHFIFKFMTLILWIPIFLPAFIFRYSLKSTAWIYLPLIWLIEPQNRLELDARMRHHSKNFMAYMMFLYSWVIIVVFTFLPLVFPEFSKTYTHYLPLELEIIFFAYSSNFNNWFGIWYLTRFTSAIMTIFFMISFTNILSRREREPNYREFISAKILSLKWIRDWSIYITLGFTAYHILGLLPDGFFVNLFENMKMLPEG